MFKYFIFGDDYMDKSFEDVPHINTLPAEHTDALLL